MHSKSGKIKIIVSDEVDEELSDSLNNGYQNNLESMKGSEFALIMFNYCIINVIKQILIKMDHIYVLLIG